MMNTKIYAQHFLLQVERKTVVQEKDQLNGLHMLLPYAYECMTVRLHNLIICGESTCGQIK